jgi:hypothetical protein
MISVLSRPCWIGVCSRLLVQIGMVWHQPGADRRSRFSNAVRVPSSAMSRTKVKSTSILVMMILSLGYAYQSNSLFSHGSRYVSLLRVGCVGEDL